MPKKRIKKPNEKPAFKKKKKLNKRVAKTPTSPIRLFLAILAKIGRPFYLILSAILVVIIFIPLIIGKTFRISLLKASKYFLGFLSITNKSLRQTKIPKINIRIPDLKDYLKLEELRMTLFEIKIFSIFAKIKNPLYSLKQRLEFKIKLRIAILLLLLISLISLILYSYLSIFRDLPSPSELTLKEPEVSTKIYDRNGILLYKIYKDKNRTIVNLTDIPPQMRFATLAAEDAEFYSHPGFSLRGIIRAITQDLKTGSLQGGSTITQQLVKNVLLSPEKTIIRKIKEIVLSVEVETAYTKDQILEMYLNEVSYGGTAYGVEEASLSYFGKNVQDLSLAEAAFLAGLPKSPTFFSPFGQNPSLAFERQREVLRLMRINKFITTEQEKVAINQKLTFVPNRTEIKAPHFVMYVRQLLVDEYGEDMVEKGGLEVTTSLDLPTQIAAEKIVKDEVNRIRTLNVGNGAALVINPQTGEILAMVGSKDYFDIKADGNVNVTTRLRQPGSSIKIVNYAYALSHDYTPASIINDSPITYVIPGTDPYTPKNYDGKYRGNISLRSALAQSRNIPAVKILASYGVPKMVDEGKMMGITTWDDPSKYGLSLTLGGGAVKATDLATVYATVANYGKRPDLHPIQIVKNYKGKVLESSKVPGSKQVLDPRIAYSLIDILKDNNARAPEFGFNSYLVIKDHPEVAVKTGTSNDLRDNWTVGFNQNYLVLTWVGNNDNSPMSRIASGVTGASPIWNKIMTAVLSDQPSIDWRIPVGMSKVNICAITGTLPCDNCPTRQEWFLDERRPLRACNPDQIQKLVNPSPIPIGNKILENGAQTTF